MNTAPATYLGAAIVQSHRRTKHDRFVAHFDAKLVGIGGVGFDKTAEGASLILRFINEAKPHDWTDVATAISAHLGVKVHPPRTTIQWLRRTYEKRIAGRKI